MLGLPPLPRTIAAALRDAVHTREHVRQSALRDLVRLARTPDGRSSAVGALGRMLESDPSASLRAEAALALADAEGGEARKALFAALDDGDGRVREFALLALGELGAAGDAELSKRLVALCGAGDAALRFQALIALERIAPEQIEAVLERAAGDSDDEVRAMAFRIAERRWPADSAPPAWLLEMARVALRTGASAVRAAAAFVLAAHRDPEAYPVIVGVVDGSVPSAGSEDIQTAIEFAALLELERARPALERRAFGAFGLRSDPIAWHGCIALARLGHERARRAILKRLDAWSYDARTLAVAAAGHALVFEARARIESFRGDPSRAAPEAVAEALRALGTGD